MDIDATSIDDIRQTLPELPDAKEHRFREPYGPGDEPAGKANRRQIGEILKKKPER